MSKIIYIHPENPQTRLLEQAVDILHNQGVIVLPTDSGYALTTAVDNKKGLERIIAIRKLEKGHYFSLLCGSLSDISRYAKVDNQQYRLLKTATPGPFTFILQSVQELPKRILSGNRKTIGIRVPDIKIILKLLELYQEPLLTTTLLLPNEEIVEIYSDDIEEKMGKQVDLIIDAGTVNFEPTTILDLSEEMPPKLIRQGQGDASPFL